MLVADDDPALSGAAMLLRPVASDGASSRARQWRSRAGRWGWPEAGGAVLPIVKGREADEPGPVVTRVLVVDDDPVFQASVTSLLRSRGFEVAGYAADLDTTFDALRRLRPDAILLDMWLAGANGLDILERLVSVEDRPPVLLTSSDPDAVTDPLARRLGAAGFVPKEELATTDLNGYFQ